MVSASGLRVALLGWACTPEPELTTDLISDNRVFNRTDWTAAGLVACIALTVYLATLAPSVTLEQSGAFAVAGQHLGIGRVPGYPLWHLLAKGFVTLFGFVRYRGVPNPAWATNLMSAVFGALSCGLVALLVARTGRAITRPPAEAGPKAFAAAVAAGLLFAVSHALWSQSVITETHTLTLFGLLLVLTAALAWLLRPCRRTAFGLAAAFALSLAQSHLTLLLLPCGILALLLAEPRLCRAFCLCHAFLWLLPCVLLRMGVAGPWLGIAVGASCVLGIALPLRLSAAGRTALGMVGIMAAGAAAYAYLPLAAEGGAPMQFGDARTWPGFLHVLARGQYERLVPADVGSARFLGQLGWYAGLLGRQFLLPFSLAALVPVAGLSRFRGPWRAWGAVCLLAFFLFSVVMLIGANPAGDIQDTFIQRVKFIPSFALWSLFTGFGFALILDWISRLTDADPADRP